MIKNLSKTLTRAGYRFNETQLYQFDHFFELLADWNKRMNLTAIAQENYLSHHLLDSLSITQALHGEYILDMGSGGGLPGVILAIAHPEKQFTLLDARNKKITFLNAVKNALSLSHVNPIHCRIEDHRPAQNYTTVTVRAFAQIDKIVTLATPVLASDGRIIAMKGRLLDEEIKQLEHIGRHYEVKSVEVYGLDAQRHVVTIYKD